MRIGIDASNIRAGGGLTYLIELLKAACPNEHGFEQILVLGNSTVLQRLPRQSWLRSVHHSALDHGVWQRAGWQLFHLSGFAYDYHLDVLFAPGASVMSCLPVPIVSMSQNLLPFEKKESGRYGFSAARWRYELLRHMQSRSFLVAAGVVFLTDYARRVVIGQLPRPLRQTAIIPHGVDDRFRCLPRAQESLSEYSTKKPFRFLYVSIVNLYKHQWHVAEAIGQLRAQGLPVAIDFVGPAFRPALERLRRAMRRCDPESRFIRYVGSVPYDDLHQVYHQADGFVFASSCENMPNILLEAMASGLPIACSNRGPMPEVLGEAGVYFDPEQPAEIAAAIRRLLEDPGLREQKAWLAYERAKSFTWERCARETFDFIARVAHETDPPKPQNRRH